MNEKKFLPRLISTPQSETHSTNSSGDSKERFFLLRDPSNWFNELSFKDTDIQVEELSVEGLERMERISNRGTIEELMEESILCGVELGLAKASHFKGLKVKHMSVYHQRAELIRTKIDQIYGERS